MKTYKNKPYLIKKLLRNYTFQDQIILNEFSFIGKKNYFS